MHDQYLIHGKINELHRSFLKLMCWCELSKHFHAKIMFIVHFHKGQDIYPSLMCNIYHAYVKFDTSIILTTRDLVVLSSRQILSKLKFKTSNTTCVISNFSYVF